MMELTYEFAVAQAAYPGFTLEDAGDRYVVETFANGVMVAAIDGLGHGKKAAQAGIAAVEALRPHPDKSVVWLLEHCNRSLQGTRGAAVSIVSIDIRKQQLEWAGVGNVAGLLVPQHVNGRKRESLLTRGGVIGFRMPTIRTMSIELAPGDTLIMTSDGIRSGFMEAAPLDQPPQQLADQILAHAKRDTDDALVLVLRLFGTTAQT